MAAILSADLAKELERFSPAEIIKRKRSNMMVHSYLYYWHDCPVWTDDRWQKVADELVTLQELFPEPIGYYDEAFADWSGATGMHLPKDDYVVDKALKLLRQHDGRVHLQKSEEPESMKEWLAGLISGKCE